MKNVSLFQLKNSNIDELVNYFDTYKNMSEDDKVFAVKSLKRWASIFDCDDTLKDMWFFKDNDNMIVVVWTDMEKDDCKMSLFEDHTGYYESDAFSTVVNILFK